MPFLQQQGAIILIADRKTGYWQNQADSLEHFHEEEILALASSSLQVDLQQAVPLHF